MERTLVKDLKNKIGKEVKIQGFVGTIRDLKNMMFLVVRDQTGEVQVIIDKEDKNLEKAVATITLESAVEISGKPVENPQVKLGGFEIQAGTVKVATPADAPLPISIDPNSEPAGLEKRLDWRFLDLRRPEHLLIFKTQTTVLHAMRDFWVRGGFIEIQSPKLLGAPSESGAEVFELKDYFGTKAYLAQSPQFYKQLAMAAGFDAVFEIGPVFRAEPSFTTRHSTEFTSIDMEMSWIDSHMDVMAFEEKWLTYVLSETNKKHGDEIEKTFKTKIEIPKTPFPKITMEEALKIVEKSGYKSPKKDDLDPEGERILGKHFKEKENHEFVFVMDYPISIRPFYHMRHPEKPNITKSFDLLWKGLEITTGAQREHRHDVLVKQAKEKELNLGPIKFYMDIFKYGTPPHGGFGFGLARFLMQMLGLGSIRESTFLFRGPNRLSP